MRNEIIQAIDTVDEVITESEIDVCVSLLDSYDKMSVIMRIMTDPSMI
jgi:glycerol-3-phosphate cytidylyltransferase-like family protein